MDISKEYIKMCDCPEIQKYRRGQKNFQIGDSIANYMLGKYSKANFQGVIIFEQFDEIRDRQLAVWLPRQDQIQEILGCVPGNHLSLMNKFVKFDYYHSLEQKWLAFYIHEKYGKIWTGGAWK